MSAFMEAQHPELFEVYCSTEPGQVTKDNEGPREPDAVTGGDVLVTNSKEEEELESLCGYWRCSGGGGPRPCQTRTDAFQKGREGQGQQANKAAWLIVRCSASSSRFSCVRTILKNVSISCTHLKREEVYWRSCEEGCPDVSFPEVCWHR